MTQISRNQFCNPLLTSFPPIFRWAVFICVIIIARNHIDLSDKASALDSEDVGAVTVNNLNIT